VRVDDALFSMLMKNVFLSYFRGFISRKNLITVKDNRTQRENGEVRGEGEGRDSCPSLSLDLVTEDKKTKRQEDRKGRTKTETTKKPI